MSIEELHRICALKRLAALPLALPGHEMIITVDRYDAFGEAKTGEEIANEVRRKALCMLFGLGAEKIEKEIHDMKSAVIMTQEFNRIITATKDFLRRPLSNGEVSIYEYIRLEFIAFPYGHSDSGGRL